MSNRSVLREKLFVKNEYDIEYQNPSAVLNAEDIAFAKKEWNINTDLHRTCINCQIRHMMKYENHVDKNGEPVRTFTVPCKGIPKGLPPGSAQTLHKMVHEEGVAEERAKLLLQSTIDPVAWAELMFGFRDENPVWHLRPYQKEQLRCSSQRIVIREGRRSGKSFVVAVKLIYYAFNKSRPVYDDQGNLDHVGPTIMIITPYQAQLINLFDEMEKLLKRNKDLSGDIANASGDSLYVKTPYFHMNFKNGAVIKGFVSGVGTKVDGSGGGTLRGQGANVIYLDEMDMIPEETLEKVIIPILMSDIEGQVYLIATSTPIGKRAAFWKWCTQDSTFKEDYLPSSVLPQWSKVKAMILSDTSPDAFQSEYMAAFIDSGYGVFKPSYVYRSRKDYTYEDTMQFSWWKKLFGVTDSSQTIRCIGIDWNQNAGTEFVVVTYLPHMHRYIVTESVNIPAGEFSGQRWREELIRLNYKWKPDYIYADEGYGHTIIEDVKITAMNMAGKAKKTLQDIETAKLTERLKAFNFSSKVELRNPFDGTPITKASKEFLVENAQRVFEDEGPTGGGIVWMPEGEKQLQNELLHYTILKRSPTTNKAVYGTESDKIGDHRLDALMLALAGIQIEAGVYSAANTASHPPVLITKEELEKAPEESLGKKLIHKLQKANMHGNLSLLEIIRSGETPEQAAARNHRGVRIPRRKEKEQEEESDVLDYFSKLGSHNNDPESISNHGFTKKNSRGRTGSISPRRSR